MKLILHIGTHKTASSSLQFFLRDHKDLLESHGVYYPIPPNGSKNFNNVAAELARGDINKVRQLFLDIHKAAIKKNCHSVVISAESFYAMTYFFRTKEQNGQNDYFSEEKKRISFLKEVCSSFEQIQIVCYLRGQDEFASSLYNQRVKDFFGLGVDYMSFLKSSLVLFDYEAHISIFETIFGSENIVCRGFNDTEGNIIKDFCTHILNSRIYDDADHIEYFDNPRLTRECLEYKKSFNKVIKDRALHFMVKKALIAFSVQTKDSAAQHKYASVYESEVFFSRYKEGNKKLSDRYEKISLPVVTGNINEGIEIPNYVSSAPFISNYIRNWIRRPDRFILLHLRRLLNITFEKFPELHSKMTPIRRYRSLIVHKLKKVIR